MTEAAIIIVLTAGAILLAQHAYAHPRGVYWKSAAGAIAAPLAAALVWALAQPANEAGLGFFLVWCVITGLGLLTACVASAAATARYIADNLRR